MSEEASLDDFLGGESGEDAEAQQADAEAGEAAHTESGETDPAAAAETDGVEPATTTYAWDGAGAECGACGETVQRRWQQEGELVCVECKDWERA
ncbi:DUF7573 domain-containing protein [Haloarcula onubensis]|uniref:DUF7573 domain-containing protein n=1 Tax=Haloarcula onubensis TaxID=2950539 RepID=A0ABU2FIK7_9EURY|nr:hypothetical protein [Halomicroarcula sp. S3CR25-11]MDS0280583.1 hypothetical protein [Halomicroarcula sp. S3CR25-11]